MIYDKRNQAETKNLTQQNLQDLCKASLQWEAPRGESRNSRRQRPTQLISLSLQIILGDYQLQFLLPNCATLKQTMIET